MGEWWWGSNVLYLIPTGDPNPANHTVEVKKRDAVFNLNGRTNTQIRGLKLFAGRITMDGASGSNTIDGITAKYVGHYATGVAYHPNDGTTGIELDGNGNVLQNSDIGWSAGNLVELKGSNQRVENNNLHDGDYFGSYWAPVFINGSGSGHKILRNTISRAGRDGIQIRANASLTVSAIEIAHNNIFDYGMLTLDGGGFYTFTNGTPNIRIHHNLVHDAKLGFGAPFPDNPAYNPGIVFGIYFDNNSTGSGVVDHNVLWNIPSLALIIKTIGLQVYNNTFGAEGTAASMGTDGASDSAGTVAKNNILMKQLGGFGMGSGFAKQINYGPGQPNPGFASPSTGNYRLTASSPSPPVNGGVVIAPYTNGYVGSAPDIGAYEFGGADWTAGWTPPATGTNLALNRPATSNSNESASYTPDKAVDGSVSTRWSSAFSDPQWIYVDLGATYNISQVVLNWEAAYATAYQVQVSSDASNWSTIYSATTEDGGIDNLTGLTGTGRYVRMYGTQRATPYGYSLWEFEVYGSAAGGDTTPPTVSITAPASGAHLRGAAVTVSANASDNVGVVGVQFKLDGANLGAEDTTSPYSISWNTTTVSNGGYTLSAVARDAAGNTTTSTTVSVTVDNSAPTVSVTAPANGATVSGANVTVSADASDNDGVVGVQFKLDGANLGAEDTASPYSVTWDTTTAGNGSHSLTAVARDAAGNITTSATVNVTVNNSTLKAHWKLDGNATDSSGNNLNGTLMGSPTFGTGKISQAINFSGSNRMDVANNSLFDFGANQDFTVSAWVKSTQAMAANTYPNIVSKDNGAAVRQGNWLGLHFSNIDARWMFEISSAGTGYRAYGRTNIADGQWHHIVGIRSGSTITTYEDGELANSVAATSASLSKAVPLSLGNFSGQSYSWAALSGSVDDVRVYNSALSSSEVQALFNEGNGSLPSPWLTQDIGAVGAAGSASHSNGTFTVNGSGADIWGTADEFRYVYQAASGNCEIIARVATQQNTHANAKAGVMIRETLAAGSKNALMEITPSNGSVYQWRDTTDGASNYAHGGANAAPYWMRLVRTGNTFTAYRSADGASWTQVGSPVTMSMGASVYIGLAVCSLVDGTLNTSTFDNVAATP